MAFYRVEAMVSRSDPDDYNDYDDGYEDKLAEEITGFFGDIGMRVSGVVAFRLDPYGI